MSEKELKILTLFKKIEQGNKSAFNELFGLYYHKLLCLAMQYVKNLESAEEITSELFVKLWLKRANLPRVSNPQIYLYTSIKNACLNLIRSEKRRKLIFSPWSTAKPSVEPAMVTDVSGLVDQELFRLLNEAVAGLPEQRRMIFIMIKEDGLKSKAVAEIMGVSIRTVENQLYKAVKSLADTLSTYLGYHPQAKKVRNTAAQRVLSFFL
ncbi:RNA polymerase sigma-70 factor [Pedobacter endophyticus]|uniref:RNA polymerase sigma-70 factor n=1 Tax=Pedobacter endophyticus TaxID=2789740 RepID=A0A7S9Q0L0_9SPHI|nr:RNA polymerase sigma-70 factor [Pedobacter endophyticus]QPH40896.1 RNA polymerase sigma-70 factor [Pedobacter endophyticus]